MSNKYSQADQTRKNFFTNILSLIANIVIGIYYTPFLVGSLGVSAYGVVPLALIINQYIGTITSALTSSFSRFYSISIQKKDDEQASRNISTASGVVLIIIAVLSPFLFAIIKNIDSVFNIPVEYVASSKLLFSFTIFSFFCSLFSSLLNVTLYSKNRLDVMNMIKIIRQVLKLVCIIIFFELVAVDLVYVGLSNLSVEVLVLLISLYYFIKMRPKNLKVGFKYFNKATLIAIFAMTIWTLVHTLGDTAIYRIDNIAVNRLWGIKDSGMLGAISEFGSYILLVTSTFASLFGPLMLIAYSKNRHDEVIDIALNQSYIVGIVSAILAGVLSGFGYPLLKIWINETVAQNSDWLIIKLIPIPFCAAGGVLAFVYRTWNKVKFPAIATLVLGFANILFVLLSVSFIESLTVVTVISISSFFAVIQSYYLNSFVVNKIYSGSGRSLLISSIKIIFTFASSYAICKMALEYITISSFPELFIGIVFAGSIISAIAYLILLSTEQRKMILNLIKRK